jgi:hypothetical protein
MLAYGHAESALSNRMIEIPIRLKEHENALAPGQTVAVDDDDYDQSTYLEHELTETKRALQLLNEATLLMLFHFWEKQVGRWAQFEGKKVSKNFEDQRAYLCHHLNPDCKMALLHLLVNIIKHDDHHADENKRRAITIWEHRERHDLFQDIDLSMPTHHLAQPYDYLHITKEHIHEFAGVARTAGPRNDETTFQLMSAQK